MPYIEAAAAPLLFLFASVSLTLSSMQVMLAAPSETLRFTSFGVDETRTMSRAYWAFSLTVMILSCLSWALLIGLPLSVIAWQLAFGLSSRERTKVSLHAKSRV
jgi:hypothetical protein